MGKQLKGASANTWRSLLFFYNKCITLLFALFCAGFGSAVRATPLISPDTTVTIRGRAYKTVGTPLRTVKLYLCEVWYSVYGTRCSEKYVPIDTTETDPMGGFVFKGIHKNSSEMHGIEFAVYDSTHLPEVQMYLSNTRLNAKNLRDTTITLYLEPYICTGVIDDKKIPEKHKTITVQYGQSIVMRLPDGLRSRIHSADLLTLKGEKAGTAEIGKDGTLSMNSKKYPPGMYILSITNNKTQLLQRILIK